MSTTISKISITVNVRSGGTLSNAIRESAIMALEEEVNVYFDHNGTEYVVNYHDLLAGIEAAGKPKS